jgi:hypothetical protein
MIALRLPKESGFACPIVPVIMRNDSIAPMIIEAGAISLIDPVLSEEKAQSCDIAWFRQL